MNRGMAIQDAHRKRVQLHRRPIEVRIKPFHQLISVCQRGNLQMLRSPAGRSQSPVIEIGLDGDRFCVRLLETEFEEVA
jgi:hypothetical protein